MHSYHHHIKDFNNATRHLTRVERSLYRDAIELYYETEQPLPADDFDRLARRLMAFSQEEKESLQFVLDEFFELTGDVYSQNRCDEEIDKFHAAKSAKSAAGKASADARRQRAEERKARRKQHNSTPVEQPLNSVETEPQQNATNQEPITNNQEPLYKTPLIPLEGETDFTESKSASDTPKKKPTKRKPQPQASDFDWSQWPNIPDQQILSDWFAMRKEKRAKVSQTVVDTFGREVTKAVQHGFTVNAVMAECVTRGWQGFKVEWLINQARGQANAPGQRIDNSAAGRIRANAQRELEEIRRQEESDHALATDGQHVWP